MCRSDVFIFWFVAEAERGIPARSSYAVLCEGREIYYLRLFINNFKLNVLHFMEIIKS